MGSVEKILLDFAVKELTTNPQFLVNVVNHFLEQKKKINPDIEKDVDALLLNLLPNLLRLIKL